MQYHPTGAAYPAQIVGLLVTEKVRGLGAQVCNIDGNQFVYPRETRDVEASAIIRECVERGKGVVTPTGFVGVWLDSPMIDIIHGPGTIEKELPAMVRQFARFGIDIIKDPILVYPTLHYQNGGVTLKPDGSTSVPNLYGAGEISGGVHGRNRLMGNSLAGGHSLWAASWAGGGPAGQGGHAGQADPGSREMPGRNNWHEAGIETDIESPAILPDYTRRASA